MTLNLQTPFPTFGGSTGGWLRSVEEEKYAITWTSPKSKYLKCLLVVQQLCVMERIYYI
jgi:hypothetical protein